MPAVDEKEQAMSSSPRTAAVHRCRFVDPSLHSITSLAITPPSWDSRNLFNWSTPGRGVLAVGRANGNIEIMTWTDRQAWVLTNTLPGPIGSRSDNLVFAHQTSLSKDDLNLFDKTEQKNLRKSLRKSPPRLFGGSGGSEIWEWNWYGKNKGTIKASLPTQGGTLWCMAVNPSSTALILGCDDGVVRMVSILDGQFEHVRQFDKVKARLLSISWGPCIPFSREQETLNVDDDDDDNDNDIIEQDSYIVAGCDDSSIRKYDVKTGRMSSKLTTDRAANEHTLVWAVGVLNDNTIVSGDSMGNVKFFDGLTNTQSQSIQAHEADVLCLAIGPDSKTIYTSGVDQRVSQFSLTGSPSSRHRQNISLPIEWIQTSKRQLHEHDVRALAISPPFVPSSSTSSSSSSSTTPSSSSSSSKSYPNIVPVLTSGGVDMSLSMITASISPQPNWRNPLSNSTLNFDETQSRKSTHVSQHPNMIHIAPERRLLSCHRDSSVAFWLIPPAPTPSSFVTGDVSKGGEWLNVLEMNLQLHTTPVCSALSPNGQWLAISDLYTTKLFWIESSKRRQGPYRPHRVQTLTSTLIECPTLNNVQEEYDTGSSSLCFSHDSSRLILALRSSSQIAIVQLGTHVEVAETFSLDQSSYRSIAARGPKQQPNGDVEMTSDADADTSVEDGEEEDNGLTPGGSSETFGQVVALTISSDNQWLVTGDSNNRLQVFNLDSLKHHTTLPTMQYPISTLAFQPSSPSTLFVGLITNTFDVFSVETGRLDPRYDFLNASNSKLKQYRDPLVGIAFVANKQQREHKNHDNYSQVESCLVWSTTWLANVKLRPQESTQASTSSQGTKRKHTDKKKRANKDSEKEKDDQGEENEEDQDQQEDVRTSKKYRDVLFVGSIDSSEIIVAERPYFSLLSSLPRAWTGKGRFGR